MSTRYFTLEEANRLLPILQPLMAELLEKRARVVREYKKIEATLNDLSLDVGGPIASALVLDFQAIETLINQIQKHGCVIKDLNVGLLDFLAQRNGRDVYLCWRYGEDKIEFYHELHTGFMDRHTF